MSDLRKAAAILRAEKNVENLTEIESIADKVSDLCKNHKDSATNTLKDIKKLITNYYERKL